MPYHQTRHHTSNQTFEWVLRCHPWHFTVTRSAPSITEPPTKHPSITRAQNNFPRHGSAAPSTTIRTKYHPGVVPLPQHYWSISQAWCHLAPLLPPSKLATEDPNEAPSSARPTTARKLGTTDQAVPSNSTTTPPMKCSFLLRVWRHPEQGMVVQRLNIGTWYYTVR